MRRTASWIFWASTLTVILIGVILLSLCVGSVRIGVREILSSLLGEGDATERSILLDIRLPRIVLGFAVGGALSISGVILQGMFRNPLVEPYTLGISGGAALGVSLSIILGIGRRVGLLSLPLSGFIGAMGVISAIYLLSVRGGTVNLSKLLLKGVMISFICSSLIMLIMSISKAEELHGIIFWIMGSLEEPNMTIVRAMLLVSLLGLVASYLFSIDLNALSLGEEEALHLGVNIERTKKLLFLLASLLTGFSVSVSGVIGFVGLVIPHIMRMIVGVDHRMLLLSSYLAGSAFLILCDTLARTIIAPSELPVGVITGVLGGGLFIYMLSRGEVTALRGK